MQVRLSVTIEVSYRHAIRCSTNGIGLLDLVVLTLRGSEISQPDLYRAL